MNHEVFNGNEKELRSQIQARGTTVGSSANVPANPVASDLVT